jgi:hypothetical protein
VTSTWLALPEIVAGAGSEVIDVVFATVDLREHRSAVDTGTNRKISNIFLGCNIPSNCPWKRRREYDSQGTPAR